MRILVANWSLSLAGGVEAYLDRVLPALARRGHELAFLCDSHTPGSDKKVRLPASAPCWRISSPGSTAELSATVEWRPDVAWVHLLSDPATEAALLDVVPAVRFAHAYQGTCVSTHKTRLFPWTSPCSRRMGAACLLHYFPRRCGGLSPITMMRLYREQRQRLALARAYGATMTLSEHMRVELVRHGIPAERLHRLPWPLLDREGAPAPERRSAAARDKSATAAWRLLFLGRMDRLKGGDVLLDALPLVRRALGRPLSVTFAGDGIERRRWEAKAARLASGDHFLSFRFVGRVTRDERSGLFADHDVLVVPSVWPEPFGLVGLEAAAHGLPSVAFAAGGIPEWLGDGISGRLAAADPPTAEGLASALVSALESPAALSSLSRGALAAAARISPDAHLDAVVSVLQSASASGNARKR
ncbi:MAG: glycosyltransferase family 4 protein [Vicinamibacterales bacterium]